MDKWLRSTNAVRLLAVVLGLLLWAVVRLSTLDNLPNDVSLKHSQELTNVSITTIGLDTSRYAVRSMTPDKVRVRLIGRDSALSRVSPKSYQVQIDLTNIGKGEHTLPLRGYGFPDGVDVEIYPPTVTVVIEEKVKKEMPVTVNVTGTPGNGYKAGQAIAKPNFVNVTVPTGLADEVSLVRADVSVDGATSTVTKQAKLTALDRNGKQIDVSFTPNVVEVEVPITIPFKTVPLQIKLTGVLPSGLAVSSYKQSIDNVTVYGPQSVLDRLDFYAGPEINLSKITASTTVSLDIPKSDRYKQVEPAKVDVELTIVPSVTKTMEVPITISGQNNDYTTQITAPANGRMTITVEGAPVVLDAVKPDNVQAVVNVSNLPPGKHERSIEFILPPFVKVTQLSVPTVTIEVTAKSKPASGGTSSPVTAPQGSQGGTAEKPAAGSGTAGSDKEKGSTPAAGSGTTSP